MKKLLITLLKVGISAGIIAYLVYEAAGMKNEAGENIFDQLLAQPKHWGLLAIALVCCFSAVTLTMIRWWCLVRALDVPLPLREAIRVGFLGYLVNLAPLGIVGGDMLKGWMLAKDRRGHRVKVFASVVIDRLIGLYMLFVVAVVAIVLTEFWKLSPAILHVCQATYVLTGIGAIGIGILIIPGFTEGRGTRALARLPRVGPAIESLIDAVRMYRRKPVVLTVSAAMSAGVHCLFATGVFLIAWGLFDDNALSLKYHFVVSPLAASTGVIPVVAGPFELVLDLLYVHVPEEGVEITAGMGLVVALGYRLICVLIAMVGVCYYLGSRREVAELMRQAGSSQS